VRGRRLAKGGFAAAAKSKRKEHAMARPKKQPHELRSVPLRTDLTQAERCFVEDEAAKAELTLAEYTRRRVLSLGIAAPSERRFRAALITEINRLGGQLATLGNLANQIALYCHTDRSIPPEWDALPSEIKGLLRIVEQTLEKVLFDDDTQDTH
jgi:hypothetical protein